MDAELSQARTALDYAGSRRAELERELQSARSDLESMKVALGKCRFLLATMVKDKRIGVDGGCYPKWAGDMVREVIAPAMAALPSCPHARAGA